MSNASKECKECGKWVSVLSLWGGFGLGAVQMITGKLSGSVALSIDGLRSLTDGIGSVFVLAGMTLASLPKDASHPYGHGKAKFLSSAVIYAGLVAVGALFLFESTIVSLSHWTRVPSKMGGVVALLSIVANYVLYNYNQCAGRHLDRPMMLSNSHGNLIAMVSACAVVTGIVAARMGYPIADPLAGVFVSLMILGASGRHWWVSLGHLMDRAAPAITVEKIRSVASSVRGVLGTGTVRTRLIGENLWVDLDILVSSDCSIETANSLAAEVRGRLLSKARRVEEIMVYYHSIEAGTASE